MSQRDQCQSSQALFCVCSDASDRRFGSSEGVQRMIERTGSHPNPVTAHLCSRARLLALIAICLPAAAQAWRYYGGDAGGTKYSALKEINRENVNRLQPAWIFHTGDVSDGTRWPTRSAFETTPLVVDGVMYLTTPFSRVIALDPETGKE